jgi:hypothetical protein
MNSAHRQEIQLVSRPPMTMPTLLAAPATAP